MKRIINLTHSDLDGIASYMLLRYLYGEDLQKIFFHYNDSYNFLGILSDSINNYTKKVFITDINLKEDELKVLKNIVLNNENVKFYFVDHHPLDVNQERVINDLKKLKNFRYVYYENISTTKIIYLLFKKKFKNRNIEKFVECVNSYDEWKKDKYFQCGFMLNEIRISIGNQSFVYNILNNDFWIPKCFYTTYEKIEKEAKEYLQKLPIYKSGNILLVFTDKFRNFIIDYYTNFDIYVIVSIKFKYITFRLSSNYEKKKEVKELIFEYCKSNEKIKSYGGYDYAFALSCDDIDEKDFENIVNDIIEVVEGFDD